MRHRDARNRLTQKPHHANLLIRNLVTSLFLYEAVRTTKSRARAVRPVIDRLITTAKKKDAMNAVRALNAFVTDKNASRKVMEVLIARYKTRPSGFTTMKAVGARKGDGAEMVDLALVDAVLARRKEAAEAPVEKKAKPAAKKAATKKTKSDAPTDTPSTPSK